MKTSKTRKNGFRTRIIATALSATMIFSVGAMTATTASAATSSKASTSYNVKCEITDGFFAGASTMIGVLTKTHPVAGVIASGLFGAFKTFYSDATKTPQPSNQDIVDLLNELSEKIDTHYNDQSSQVKALENIEKLQNMSNILTSVKGYNEKAMGQISLYNDKDVCAQDYQNIIDCTIGKDNPTSNSISYTGFKTAIPKRNRYMVDNASTAICYVSHISGGAYKTYQLAQKKNLKTINIYDEIRKQRYERTDLMQSEFISVTTELLALACLAQGAASVYEITKFIAENAIEGTAASHNQVYTALYYLCNKNYVKDEEITTDNGLRRTRYTLLSKGKEYYKTFLEDYNRHIQSVSKVLNSIKSK